jgi:4-hydroxybenzoate polyprenyltransferase
LAVYNLDRLHLDPADQINTPLRRDLNRLIRPWRFGVIASALVVLICWPIATGRAWLSPVLLAVVAGLQFYSRRLPGLNFRLKDLKYLKSLLAAVFIGLLLALWPPFEAGRTIDGTVGAVLLWCIGTLLMNGLVFDYRDISGDRLVGTRTLAVALGSTRARRLILVIGLTLILVDLGFYVAGIAPIELSWIAALPTAGLLLSLACRLHPMFLSFIADLYLLVPAVAELVARR